MNSLVLKRTVHNNVRTKPNRGAAMEFRARNEFFPASGVECIWVDLNGFEWIMNGFEWILNGFEWI